MGSYLFSRTGSLFLLANNASIYFQLKERLNCIQQGISYEENNIKKQPPVPDYSIEECSNVIEESVPNQVENNDSEHVKNEFEISVNLDSSDCNNVSTGSYAQKKKDQSNIVDSEKHQEVLASIHSSVKNEEEAVASMPALVNSTGMYKVIQY